MIQLPGPPASLESQKPRKFGKSPPETRLARKLYIGNPMKATKSSKLRRARSRGAVMVEYTLLLAVVGIPSASGLVLGGTKMLKYYHASRDMLLLPIP